MGIVAKKDFEDWVKDKDWLQVKDTPIQGNRQLIYVTPSGNFVIAAYNLKKELVEVCAAIFVPPTPANMGIMPGGGGFKIPGLH